MAALPSALILHQAEAYLNGYGLCAVESGLVSSRVWARQGKEKAAFSREGVGNDIPMAMLLF